MMTQYIYAYCIDDTIDLNKRIIIVDDWKILHIYNVACMCESQVFYVYSCIFKIQIKYDWRKKTNVLTWQDINENLGIHPYIH